MCPQFWDVRLDAPIGEWKKTLGPFAHIGKGRLPQARPSAHIHHSAGREPHVSEETILALAGHVSRRMPERYSHIRTRAKEDAIRTLEQHQNPMDGALKWAQSENAGEATPS